MPPDRGCFTAVNLPQSFSLPPSMEYFTVSAGPNTDLWRKPPDRDTATAPILYTSLRQPFVIAEVTVTADWEMEWDQGGLVIFAGAPPRSHRAASSTSSSTRPANRASVPNNNNTANTTSSGRPSQPPPYPTALPTSGSKWVKAGLEFSAGTVNVSSVSATSDGADWCLSPLVPPPHMSRSGSSSPPSINSLRIKLERIGHSLWIWFQIPSLVHSNARTVSELSSSWRKLREVTWFFWDVEDKNVHVGVYASRPSNLSPGETVWASREGRRFARADTGPGGLMVEFENLEIF